MKGAIYYEAIATVIFSHMKISSFRAKAHLVFHWCLYNKLIYSLVTKILRNCDNANLELCKVANWLAVSKLSLNVKKTHFVIFREKTKKLTNNLSMNIGNQNIEQGNTTNFLKLNIDQGLSWKHHIKKVSSKIAKLHQE